MGFADWLVGAGLRLCPPHRAQWAEAMHAEYKSADKGKLSWALGCFAVCLNWRLGEEKYYALLLIAACWFMTSSFSFFLPLKFFPLSAWQPYLNIGLYFNLIWLAAVNGVLAFYRPQRMAATALFVLTVYNSISIYHFYAHFGAFPGGPEWTIVDARPLIGLSAQFGAALGGGLIGRALAFQPVMASGDFGQIPKSKLGLRKGVAYTLGGLLALIVIIGAVAPMRMSPPEPRRGPSVLEIRAAARSVLTAAPIAAVVMKRFGSAIDPQTHRLVFHRGDDYRALEGAAIVAPGAGVVTRIEQDDPERGVWLEIDHGLGLVTRYEHLSVARVSLGDHVRTGQLIASVGHTGVASEPHLHFEVYSRRLDREHEFYIDPETVLPAPVAH